MIRSFRRAPLCAFSLAVLFVAASGAAQAQNDPPARVGRLAFTDGAVSFHDQSETGWSKAIVNTPLTSGDAVWTEPNARSELSVAGTRVRLDGGTQLEMLALDDSQTRLQVDQGRLDIKTFSLDGQTPYSIATPRGTITLQQQGDYYVEAGSTQDATRLGVRSGAAQIQSLNGQTLAVRAGEVGEIDGDSASPQLRTVAGAPPPPVPYWAARDSAIGYQAPPQYLSTGMTGYEDLGASGIWANDSQYGQVWSPRNVPADWQPYRTGHWTNMQPWGWTWVDDQSWGYAPYHYGRWAQRDSHWVWVPPQREAQPVYAPALVAFIGGIELSVSLGNQGNAPVGWFPLGPREAYVPAYTTDRAYYDRINQPEQVQKAALDDRWQRNERHEPPASGAANAPVNQRFAVVVPADTFVRSQPVARAALKVAPDKIAAAPVAPVSAPPAATASLGAGRAAETKPGDTKPADAKAAPNTRPANAPATQAAPAKTASAAMPTLAPPATPEKGTANGPKIATTTTQVSTAPADGKHTAPAPALQPRTGAAPPKLAGAATPVPPTTTPGTTAGKPEIKPEAGKPEATGKPAPVAPVKAAPAPAAPSPPAKPETRPEAAKPEATARPAPAEPAKAPPAAPLQARPEAPKTPVEAPKEVNREAPKPAPVAQPEHKAPEAKAPEAKAPEAKPPERTAAPVHVAPPETARVAPPVPAHVAPTEVDKKPGAPVVRADEEKKDEKK
jgi:hypothetical protein